MAQNEIQLRDALFHLLKEMDASLLQRITDYARGLMDASSEHKHDWWNELTEEEKADLKESMLQGEMGQEKPMEEVFKKYGIK